MLLSNNYNDACEYVKVIGNTFGLVFRAHYNYSINRIFEELETPKNNFRTLFRTVYHFVLFHIFTSIIITADNEDLYTVKF